ncbi:MAG: hypothetical protein PHO56_00595 [Patescibacteria group bacterium]|nr:hypothetical protein [Patescibacteria group bacterium]
MNDSQWEKLIAESLREAGKKIEPPRELLAKIITAAKTAVDLKPSSPVNKNWQGNFNFIFSRKLFISAGAIMIMLAVFFSLPANLKQVHQSANVNLTANHPAVDIADQNINNQPLTTDDVDEAVTAILASVSDENPASTDVDDQSLIDADSSAINNLMQNYDQTQL